MFCLQNNTHTHTQLRNTQTAYHLIWSIGAQKCHHHCYYEAMKVRSFDSGDSVQWPQFNADSDAYLLSVAKWMRAATCLSDGRTPIVLPFPLSLPLLLHLAFPQRTACNQYCVWLGAIQHYRLALLCCTCHLIWKMVQRVCIEKCIQKKSDNGHG